MEGEIDVCEFRKQEGRVPPPAEIVEKAKWLLSTFACFSSDKPPPHKQHRSAASDHHHQHNANSHRRNNKELSTEAITIKNIMTLMNKLSPANKEHIVAQVRASFREEFAHIYVKLIWDFMLRSPEHQDLYTDVLLILAPHVNTAIAALYDDWCAERRWLMRNSCDTEQYDEFCDYVKEKARAIATIKGFGYLMRKRLLPEDVYNDVVRQLVQSGNEYIGVDARAFESVLEQLKAVYHPALMDAAVAHISRWMAQAPDLPPAVRFKVYDLNDKMSQKQNSLL